MVSVAGESPVQQVNPWVQGSSPCGGTIGNVAGSRYTGIMSDDEAASVVPGATKRCGSCGATKPLAEFNRKRSSSDGRQQTCRECHRDASRRYYAMNRDAHVRAIVERTARRRVESKVFLATYLESHACVDCGQDDIRVLDFDHRPGERKRKDVMQMVKEGFSLFAIEAELLICDVRCRNCHAIVTLDRAPNNWRSRAHSRRQQRSHEI